MLHNTSKVALIIPCYNEEKRLRTDDFFAFVRRTNNVDLCFVDDGSNDGTSILLKQLSDALPGRVSTYFLSKNAGKAEAVRRGIIETLTNHPANEFIGYWDADLSTPLHAVFDFLDIFNKYSEVNWVSGARVRRRGANIQRTMTRHFLGRCLATLVTLTYGVHFYDTQCGAKIFKKKVVKELFSDPFISRWLFDIELILRFEMAHSEHRNSCYELPLSEWIHVGASKVSFSTYTRAMVDFIRIYNNYH